MNKTRKKVVITGATSKFGRLVVPMLEKNYDLTLVTRNASKAKQMLHTKSKIVEIDLENATKQDLLPIVRGADCVVNIAGLVDFTASKEKLFKANAYATQILVDACLDVNVKNFVHCSSIAIYSFKGTEKINEESKTSPRNAYGQSKLAGELAVTNSTLNWISLRPGIIYGPNFKTEVEFLVKMAKNKRLKLIGKGENHVPLVYETDVAYAFAKSVDLLLTSKVRNEAINLVADQNTQRECFEILLKELGMTNFELKSMPLIVILNLAKLLKTIGAGGSLIDPEVMRVLSLDRKFDNSKAKKLLGVKFTNSEEGIKKTLKEL